MWSFSRLVRTAGALAALGLPVALSACSGLTPVYGTNAVATQQVAIAYAAPNNRIEQLIYQNLALHLGRASSNAPTLNISATSTDMALSSTNDTIVAAQTQRQVTVGADIRLTDVNGKVLFSGSRAEDADYTAGAQVAATNQAQQDAIKRASLLLADTIRLTVLGALKP